MATKTKKAAYAAINDKLAKSVLKNLDSYMDQLRAVVGKKGDGANGGSTTLIGSIEGLNNEAYDGQALTAAYKKFNNTTLPAIKSQVSNLDMEFGFIDMLSK